jgi:RND superfamily putative drug exporter
MLRHPRRTLGLALLVIAALAAFGFDLEERLSPATLDISGTPVSRANALLREHFGDTAPFVVLLQGPSAALDRQGPELVRTLRRDPKVTTLSPWDRGVVGPLRPTPRRALILLDFHVGAGAAVKEKVPLLNRTLEEKIHAPVRATQTGAATITRSIQDGSISAAERGELIAFPILLIVLLLVFRSPVAAAIPLGFGAVSVLTSRGLLSILTHWFGVEALALTVCSMMGLALGVDYALLMVSRFREELAAGADPIDAAWATRRTAGRTTVFAGSTLVLSMVVALFVVPGSLLASLAGTLALVVVLTVAVATLVGPPLLVLLGPNIDRWRLGAVAPEDGSSRLMRFVSAALRRPAPAAIVIGTVVLVLAAPALGLKTGPFSPEELPRNDPARRDAERIGNTVGDGFEAPYVIVAATKHGPITEPQHLAALTRWQRRLAALPGVRTVIGPEQVASPVEPLRKGLSGLLASNGEAGPLAGLGRLGRNLARAGGGVALLRQGLSQASSGAGLLAEGSGKAGAGALAISRGLTTAAAGSERAVNALDTFATGSRKLAAAQNRAALAALLLKLNLPNVGFSLRQNALRRSRITQKSLNEDAKVTLPKLIGPAQAADERLKAALQQLQAMTVGQSDPHYAPALEAVRQALAAVSGTDPVSGQPYAPEYTGLPAELTELQKRLLTDFEQTKEVTAFLVSEISHLKRFASVAKRLSDGLEQIKRGGNKLAHGSARLAHAASSLQGGIGRLVTGSSALAEGISRLTGGATALEENLAAGFHRSAPLQSGLRRASVRVIVGNARLQRRLGQVRRASPGLFDSGYFVLSALDGTRGQLHERASEAVSLENGGQAATLLVTPRYTFNSPGSLALNKRLEGAAAGLSKEAGLVTGVAGGTATLNTYSRVTREKIPLEIIAITLATFLVLVLVLRALPLAAIAVGLNLATVGVAFGVLTLLTVVPDDWPLGGHNYIDAVGVTMIFGVVFGLSIDYAVFLLVRMREHYDRHGDNAAAVEFGLQKTARVITGAAAIMMAVFIAFAGAPIATVSQLGVGLTVAVLLDATVVRIVLLPALMLLIGDRVWWLPRPLERVLPRLNV